MTTNKEKILHAAMHLFAHNGYDGTPTSQIAREAGVSEGLIFRHFGSKSGLLQAIVALGLSQVAQTMAPYQEPGADPLAAIRQHIRNSFQLLRTQGDFWRLVQQIRFQPVVQQVAAQPIAAAYHFIASSLIEHFRLLGKAQPDMDALALFALIDGITLQYLQQPDRYPLEAMEQYLLEKYTN